MALARDRIRLGLAVGALSLTALSVSGCGSDALTNNPAASQPAAGRSQQTDVRAGLAGAVSKLSLISQDDCQTGPPEQVYPVCNRFLAELRSAATTLRDGASGLPNGPAVRVSAAGVLAAADAYDRDGCGAGSPDAGRCGNDLRQVRTGVSALVDETKGVPGG
jgi:hypothetical protein